MFMKDKFGLGPEFTGKTIEVSQGQGSEWVEPQVVDETAAVDQPKKQLKAPPEAVKTHLNVGAQAASVMNEKSSQVDNLRVWKLKRILPSKSWENK